MSGASSRSPLARALCRTASLTLSPSSHRCMRQAEPKCAGSPRQEGPRQERCRAAQEALPCGKRAGLPYHRLHVRYLSLFFSSRAARRAAWTDCPPRLQHLRRGRRAPLFGRQRVLGRHARRRRVRVRRHYDRPRLVRRVCVDRRGQGLHQDPRRPGRRLRGRRVPRFLVRGGVEALSARPQVRAGSRQTCRAGSGCVERHAGVRRSASRRRSARSSRSAGVALVLVSPIDTRVPPLLIEPCRRLPCLHFTDERRWSSESPTVPLAPLPLPVRARPHLHRLPCSSTCSMSLFSLSSGLVPVVLQSAFRRSPSSCGC